ncbi:hypothetical protein BO71DRAFT_406541 [Aspergillus ellipticus CBS 707.79]|uniref:Uncharacterized protein n=1 Tax=Aspergillus ellipticus CBS 707.79 TaxID=1448320 RepID=A0A319DME1_9EURO|nr:hypothetical protein BO71DRAFT_406541 [Aspergillus ellipticus CBS 707.79]
MAFLVAASLQLRPLRSGFGQHLVSGRSERSDHLFMQGLQDFEANTPTVTDMGEHGNAILSTVFAGMVQLKRHTTINDKKRVNDNKRSVVPGSRVVQIALVPAAALVTPQEAASGRGTEQPLIHPERGFQSWWVMRAPYLNRWVDPSVKMPVCDLSDVDHIIPRGREIRVVYRVAAHHGLKKDKLFSSLYSTNTIIRSIINPKKAITTELNKYQFYLFLPVLPERISGVNGLVIQIYNFEKKITGKNTLKYWILYLSWQQARYLYELKNKILYKSSIWYYTDILRYYICSCNSPDKKV